MTSNVKLGELLPQVTWAREVSANNKTFLPISHSYWYDQAGIDFENYGKYRCNLLDEGENVTIYNCSYYIRKCDYNVHFVGPKNPDFRLNYQCTVEAKNESISMCVTGNYYNF